MKQPSIDAIRRFKEQQERKKHEETERKIQEKLSTLEHRAAQGDRKAKSELKIIEKVKEEKIKQSELKETNRKIIHPGRHMNGQRSDNRNHPSNGYRGAVKQPKRDVTDFDELMRLAASNNNQIREKPKPPSPPPTPKRAPMIAKRPPDSTRHSDRTNRNASTPASRAANPPQPSSSRSSMVSQRAQMPASKAPQRQQKHANTSHHDRQTTVRPQQSRPAVRPIVSRPPPNPLRRPMVSSHYAHHHRPRDDYYDDDDEEYEDDYEHDDFVVDDGDAETQDEVTKTIRSVFNYDKRRCDLREAELDRQYRQIGRVSTFEDLEREERRASRLAAVEDARALREEEERKRLKKMRLKGH